MHEDTVLWLHQCSQIVQKELSDTMAWRPSSSAPWPTTKRPAEWLHQRSYNIHKEVVRRHGVAPAIAGTQQRRCGQQQHDQAERGYTSTCTTFTRESSDTVAWHPPSPVPGTDTVQQHKQQSRQPATAMMVARASPLTIYKARAVIDCFSS
jgi:hypothetical protein